MEKINTETSLRDAILQLERKWEDEGQMVKEQFFLTIESIKPINLIKSTFKDAIASHDLKGNIVNTSFGLTAGFLSKLLIQGVVKSPLNRLVGTAVMFGITKLVSKNPETVKSIGKGFFNMIRRKTGDRDAMTEHHRPKQIG